MNEEDLKGKIILPYLNDLGLDVSEISFESGFSIRLGKKKHITGRSDILCKRNNRNLFVIELKSDSVEITQNDIDQGISYARLLLDDIAPFTIVSNGMVTKIFDTITRREIIGNIINQSNFFTNGYSLSTDENLKIRYEALKNFVTLSTENLKIFCESQVHDRMGPIVGFINSPYAKFVKELYVQREELQIAFENFLNSSQSIFGLVGNAGVGKTSAICSLTLQKLSGHFVFFYNAAIIQSPLECIAQDLNIAFSGRLEADTALKKLDEIGRFANKKVLVFIDAVDENTNSNISLELSEIALIVKNLDKVKVIVSCKSNIWSSILMTGSQPTHLHEELGKYHSGISSLNGSPGFLLNDFSDEELKGIVPLYQKAFDFKGVMSDSLLNDLRNGFFLKIFSEVYAGKNVPNQISDKELIKKYLNLSLEQTNINLISGTRILGAMGKLMLNYNYSSWQQFKDEGLDINYFHQSLNLSLDENIPEDLFTRNILIRSNGDESYNISFYYSKIRDYVICFHSYQLDKLNDNDFYEVLCDFYQNHIGKSALDFYIENASPSHLNTLYRFKTDKALQYVEAYDYYLESNFKEFKNKFDPYTKSEIGILLPTDLINGNGYAHFPIERGNGSKLMSQNFLGSLTFDSDVASKLRINTIYGSNTALFAKNQGSVVKKNIFKQLKEIISKGKLNAYNSDVLLQEEVIVILYYYHKKLEYEFSIDEFYLPRYNFLFPINLKDLKLRIDKFKFKEFYKYHSIDKNTINDILEKAIAENHEIPDYNTIGDAPPFKELGKIVDVLLSNGYTEIKNHYLPLPDKTIQEARLFYDENKKDHWKEIRVAQFSEAQAKLYITEFFRKLEVCYKDFVDYCFPTFKDEFPFYTGIPHEYLFYMKESNVKKWGWYGFRSSSKGRFEITFKDMEDEDEAFKNEGLKSLHAFSLDGILRVNDYARYPVKTVDKLNTSSVDEHCLLRNWVYKKLEDDMEKLFKENND